MKFNLFATLDWIKLCVKHPKFLFGKNIDWIEIVLEVNGIIYMRRMKFCGAEKYGVISIAAHRTVRLMRTSLDFYLLNDCENLGVII